MKFLKFILIFLLGVSMASAKDIPNLAIEIKIRLEKNPETAFSWIEAQGSPTEVCDIYDKVVRDLYWLDKGAKNLVVVGNRGITFCLEQANQYVKTRPELENLFKSQAKTIAYNVAANSWPGWGDDGVSITTNETQIGLEAAKLNLSLAFELKKSDDKIAAAYWLLSAMQLALAKYMDGLNSIDLSNEYAVKAGDETVLAYNESFKGLILLALGRQNEGVLFFDTGISKLKSIGTDDANSYISQLEVARKIFVQ